MKSIQQAVADFTSGVAEVAMLSAAIGAMPTPTTLTGMVRSVNGFREFARRLREIAQAADDVADAIDGVVRPFEEEK